MVKAGMSLGDTTYKNYTYRAIYRAEESIPPCCCLVELPGRSACQSNREVLTERCLIRPFYYG